MEENSEAQDAVSEAGVLENHAKGEPFGLGEISRVQDSLVGGGEEFLAHGDVKLGGERCREALEVPVVIAEFDGVHAAAKLGKLTTLRKEGFDFLIFVDDAAEFSWTVH